MASTQVLAAQASQVIANLVVVTPANTAAITSVTMLPRLGAAQPVKVRFLVNGTVDIEVEVILYDKAFEESGLYGERKKRERKAALEG